MKRIIALVLAALVPVLAAAQDQCFVRNNSAASTLQSENLRYSPAAVSSLGELFITSATTASAIAKAEDSGHTTADVGVMSLGVTSTAETVAFTSTNAEYAPYAIDVNTGGVVSSVRASGYSKDPFTPAEDVATFGGGNGATPFFAREVPLTVNTSSNNEWTYGKADKFGRQLVSLGVDGSDFKCTSGSDITDTSSTAVCAADADEIYNITTITCSNTDPTVETRVDILDGATVVWQMTLGAADSSDQSHTISFVTPLKMAAINTAINAQPATTSSQTRCSISGFKTPS